MKARYKGTATKKITVGGETLLFAPGEWVVLPTIALYNRIKAHPDLFDIVLNFDITPFKKHAAQIRFGQKTVSSNHKPTVRALESFKLLRRQAVLPDTNTVVFRIKSYSDVYLKGFVSLQDEVNVLCFRSKGGIGDILMTTPTIEAIDNTYPNYTIDFACPKEYMPLLAEVPHIRQVLDVATVNQGKYDIVYDMTRKCIQYEGKTQPEVDLNRTEIFGKVVGLEPSELPTTKFYLSPSEATASLYINFERSAKIGALVTEGHVFNDKLVIGVAMDSSAPVRSYPYVNEFMHRLSERYPDSRILFFQKEKKFDYAEYDNVRVFTNFGLRAVAMLISRCDVFVGADTGLTHIANGLKIPTVWFFTHIDGDIRTRGYFTNKVIQVRPPACPAPSPCWYLFPCDSSQSQRESLKGMPCAQATRTPILLRCVEDLLRNPHISVMIIGHNQFRVTEECIRRVAKTLKFNDELIFSNNGSSDQTHEYFKDYSIHCRYRYIHHLDNTGCIHARNTAMGYADGRYWWILDNDQLVSDNSLQMLRQTEGDLVGVEAYFIDSKGYAIKNSKAGRYNYVGAGGLFGRREVFQDIGRFDPEYSPAWFEDPDLCFRATLKGYSLGLCENASIEHLAHTTNHTQTDFNSSKIWERNRQYFVKKWSDVVKPPIVSIVILSHNDSKETIRCLNSIYQHTKMHDFEVILVDNGSDKNELELLENYVNPNLRLLKNSENLMVAAGRNAGARLANGEFILFLDNDMVVPRGWLPKILAVTDASNSVACSPRVVDVDHRGTEKLRFFATQLINGVIKEIKTVNNEIVACDFLPGGALFVQRDIFQHIQFDEKYIFGVEDYDWCMQVRQKGFKLVNCPDVIFYHYKDKRVQRTIIQYDNLERGRKGSSYIEDSIRLFLYRWQHELYDQWREPGWLQWAVGNDNMPTTYQEFKYLIETEVAKLYPDEILREEAV
jgi:GT2 family glycosyltransferase